MLFTEDIQGNTYQANTIHTAQHGGRDLCIHSGTSGTNTSTFLRIPRISASHSIDPMIAGSSFLWWISCYFFVSSTQKSGWVEGGSPVYGIHVPGIVFSHHTFQHHPCVSPPKKLTVRDQTPHPSLTISTEVISMGSTSLELRKKRPKKFREYLCSQTLHLENRDKYFPRNYIKIGIIKRNSSALSIYSSL